MRTDPESKASRMLDVLRDRPNEPVSLDDFVDLGFSRDDVAMMVPTRMNRGGRKSDWRFVKRVARGVYLFDPYDDEADDETPDWTEVARDGDLVVLRGPDGSLYAARPLA